MDPNGDHNRKVLSPLDKIDNVKKEEVADKILPSQKSSDILTTAEEEQGQENTESDPSLVDHLTDLRKQLVKSAAVFLFFIIVIFSTINFWFPYVTRGHELIVLGPLEVVKFYMSISTALAFGLTLPFLSHFLWQFVEPGLNERESRFLSLYSPVMLVIISRGCVIRLFYRQSTELSISRCTWSSEFQCDGVGTGIYGFLLMTTMPIGLLFELPIVALFLATIGLLTADSMRKVRKWSYLVDCSCFGFDYTT